MRAVNSTWKIVVVLVTWAGLATGCLGPGKWFPDPHPPAPGVLLQQYLARRGGDERAQPPRIPEIPARKKARMCCAFGTDLRVKMGDLPIPFLKVGHVLDLGELGPHRYDGATAAIDDRRARAFPGGESNGLMYTCHGGFIDTAHVRETVDWTAYFISVLDRHLETGTTVTLSPEGAERRLVLHPVPPELVEEFGRDAVIVALAQWIAYQGSVWHEIAQWYGWSLVTLYPETLSGFSPEDPISNAIGVNLLSGIDIEQCLASEKTYNAHVDQLIRKRLAELRPVSADLGEAMVAAVDDAWWDSKASLPDNALVRRRYLDTDTELGAWLVPDHLKTPELRARLAEQCGEHPEPAVVRVPDSLGGIPFGDLATLEIVPSGNTAEQPVFEHLTLPITQADFPRLMEDITASVHAQFGPRADRPD
jgi:hypothetical protein